MSMDRIRTSKDECAPLATLKTLWRLLPLMLAIYFLSFLDRTNVGMAKSALQHQFGIGPEVYGFGAGVFYWAYALCEVPSNLIAYRVGPRRWIARIAVTWRVPVRGDDVCPGRLVLHRPSHPPWDRGSRTVSPDHVCDDVVVRPEGPIRCSRTDLYRPFGGADRRQHPGRRFVATRRSSGAGRLAVDVPDRGAPDHRARRDPLLPVPRSAENRRLADAGRSRSSREPTPPAARARTMSRARG